MEKAKQCRTPEELFALAKEEGVELTTEQLDAIAAVASSIGTAPSTA